MIGDNNLCANYLRDLIYLLKEEALKASQDKKAGKYKNRSFAEGRSLAYYEVISLMQEQAKSFEIPLEELNLTDINPDKDLI